MIRQDGPWWLGWVEEVPGVNAQERSRDKLLESLRQVLREALEFNRIEALEAAGPGSEDLALSLGNAGIGFGISTTTAASFSGKAATLHGGGTQFRIAEARSRAIPRSTTCWPAKTSRTWACLHYKEARRGSHHDLIGPGEAYETTMDPPMASAEGAP